VGQGLLPFRFEAAPRPMDLTAHAGLTLIAETLLALGVDTLVRDGLQVRARRRGYAEFDTLQAIVLIQAAGGDCVEDVRVLARDAGLTRLLHRRFPSPDALHRFLASFHDERLLVQRPATGAWIPAESPALQALAALNTTVVRRAVTGLGASTATLDLDATTIGSHKRDALPLYTGGRGYQPTAVCWAEQDLVVADQYRDGNVPAGMDPLTVAQRAFAALPPTVTGRAFRGDSACYYAPLLKHLVQKGIAFTISADMTEDLAAVCTARGVRWRLFEDRVTETVEVAEIEFTPGNWPRRAAPLRYVALRFSPKQGHLFGEGPRHLAVVSNRWNVAPAALLRWHWAKAGTIEFVHDVTKNELAARLPPSGKFGANAAWYRLALLTYNLCTVLRRQALPARFAEARPRRLRYEVFTLPAALVTHARQLTAQLGVPPLTAEELIAARGQLRALRTPLWAANGAASR
jgi:DDE family transposase